jgi:hypothetical protein
MNDADAREEFVILSYPVPIFTGETVSDVRVDIEIVGSMIAQSSLQADVIDKRIYKVLLNRT